MLKGISFAPEYGADEHGNIWSLRYRHPRRLKTWDDANGRARVRVRVNRTVVTAYVSRLVADAFHGASSGRDAHHIDGNRKNNRPDNLRWVAREQHVEEHHPVCPTCGKRQ